MVTIEGGISKQSQIPPCAMSHGAQRSLRYRDNKRLKFSQTLTQSRMVFVLPNYAWKTQITLASLKTVSSSLASVYII